jgi:hypothetical protein
MSAPPWVCGSCRSINQPREGRCYRCRTPRELVEADPETLIVAGAGSTSTEIVRPRGVYSGSGGLAFLAQVLIVAAIVITVISSVLGADLVGRLLDGDAAAGDAASTTVAIIGGGGLVVGGAALVAFAVWLSRVVRNVPIVGLGWTNLTPNQALFEAVIPGVNLYRVPAVLRDIVNRLEPGGRGEALIAGAWLGLVGGVLLPRVLSWAIVFIVGSLEEFISMRVLVGQLALGLTVAGAIVLIILIQWVETRMQQRAADPATAPGTAADAGVAASAAAPVASTAPASPGLELGTPAAASAPAAEVSPARPEWATPRATPEPFAAATVPAGEPAPPAGQAVAEPADPPIGAPEPAAPSPASVSEPVPAPPSPEPAAPRLSPALRAPATGLQPAPPTSHWTEAVRSRNSTPAWPPPPGQPPAAEPPAREPDASEPRPDGEPADGRPAEPSS